jgi:hypothetical protein
MAVVELNSLALGKVEAKSKILSTLLANLFCHVVQYNQQMSVRITDSSMEGKHAARTRRLQSRLHIPVCSGIAMAMRVSPESALSETKRSLSKSILAPEEIATKVLPSTLFSLMYFTIPAMARAPAGSNTHLVSLNPILIAAHISSAII